MTNNSKLQEERNSTNMSLECHNRRPIILLLHYLKQRAFGRACLNSTIYLAVDKLFFDINLRLFRDNSGISFGLVIRAKPINEILSSDLLSVTIVFSAHQALENKGNMINRIKILSEAEILFAI